ncbi:MAG: endonuclease/exonuclease/phosphatase family protein [Saprospiraceae bacterium]|nr:endonuclease/exonuclease/phosphatase family protein [Saprospiraceae bacterium]MBP6568275.1 endonuclease/exonuclease/phosphatase family protein [Saprospiraceae bacterium]
MRILLIILFFIPPADKMIAQHIKAMTYNIRLNVDSDGINSWVNRKDYFLSQIQFYEPDVLGVQEVTPGQLTEIAAFLKDYSYVGKGRDENNQGESSNIFFKKDRFNIKDSGTFWLSETPDKVSKGWDAAINRVCTYVLLQDKTKRKSFWVFNTHLDHMGEMARTNGILLIMQKMKMLNKTNLPVIFMGDFNSEPGTERIKALKNEMLDTRDISIQKPFGPDGTFNGFKHNEAVTKLIDYIFISKGSPFVVQKYAVLSDSKDLKYPSDHLPVYVDIKYK